MKTLEIMNRCREEETESQRNTPSSTRFQIGFRFGVNLLETRNLIWFTQVQNTGSSTSKRAASHVEMSKLIIFFCALFGEVILLRGELWKEDLTSAMKIGLSTRGYKSVDLRCGSSHFLVNVTLDHDFEGVVYTRGSFKDKKLPCFIRHDQDGFKEGNKPSIELRIPFRECGTVMDVAESVYTNTLVVQHDPDLIMPGDAAFSLNCAFVPEFKVGSDVGLKELPYKSKITLVDADPSAEEENLDKNPTASSKNEEVTFVPNSGAEKDEL